MGFFNDLGKAFGLVKDKSKGYEGYRPPATLKSIPEGAMFADLLRSRASGGGNLGYDPKVLSKATAPYAKAARDAYTQTTAPSIASTFAARGLGRSSIAGNRLALEKAGVESDIAQKVANMQIANEQLKQQQRDASISGLGQFAQAEAGQRGARATFDRATTNDLSTLENQATSNQMAGLNNLFNVANLLLPKASAPVVSQTFGDNIISEDNKGALVDKNEILSSGFGKTAKSMGYTDDEILEAYKLINSGGK